MENISLCTVLQVMQGLQDVWGKAWSCTPDRAPILQPDQSGRRAKDLSTLACSCSVAIEQLLQPMHPLISSPGPGPPCLQTLLALPSQLTMLAAFLKPCLTCTSAAGVHLTWLEPAGVPTVQPACRQLAHSMLATLAAGPVCLLMTPTSGTPRVMLADGVFQHALPELISGLPLCVAVGAAAAPGK